MVRTLKFKKYEDDLINKMDFVTANLYLIASVSKDIIQDENIKMVALSLALQMEAIKDILDKMVDEVKSVIK